MRVIYKAPGGKPEIRDIPNTLEELQASVGGYIESCTFATNATVICNEEGRLRGLPYNCRFLGVDFVGPILIVGIDGDEFADLDPETMGLLMRGCKEYEPSTAPLYEAAESTAPKLCGRTGTAARGS